MAQTERDIAGHYVNRERAYYVRCDDGFINERDPFEHFHRALERAEFLDVTETCGPHTVYVDG